MLCLNAVPFKVDDCVKSFIGNHLDFIL